MKKYTSNKVQFVWNEEEKKNPPFNRESCHSSKAQLKSKEVMSWKGGYLRWYHKSNIFWVNHFVFVFFVFISFSLSGRRGLFNLNLDVRNGSTGTTKVSLDGLGVLGVVVGDGGLDGILGKHGAVHCYCQYLKAIQK